MNGQVYAQRQVLDNKMHHLRWGTKQEWTEFPRQVESSKLIVHFSSTFNALNRAIFLRQYDVSKTWQILLNDYRLGTLTVDEKDMISYFNIPKGYLREGDNTLLIESTEAIDQSNEVSDDIRIGEIVLEQRTVWELLTESGIDIEVYDAKTRHLIPSRINILSSKGILQQPGIETGDTITSRTGVIYTGTGRASFGLPAGTYKIYAGRGFEYGVDSILVTIKSGERIQKKLTIEREVRTDGWISCDPHVHTVTYSGHGDATVAERVLTIAGEGIDFPVITDHNVAVDIRPVAEMLKMSSQFEPVTGNEVTTRVGHFNIFPLSTGTSGTNYKAGDWNFLAQSIRETPGVKAIILNHARDIHNGFRPFDPKHHISVAGMDLRGWNFPANGMEILNSGSQQTDPRQLYFDWFGMMNRGYFLTPVGSSDSHDVGRYMVGQARTYIRTSNKMDLGKIEFDEAIENFVDGKVAVSFGLLTEMNVNNIYGPGDLVPVSDKIVVSIKVSGPRWTSANRITLFANGQKIREASIAKSTIPGIKWKGSWVLSRPKHDLFLVAIAEGPGIHSPYWPIAKPFQHTSPDWKPLVIGSSGAIWIDADKDKKRTSAYDYAKALWVSSNADVKVLVQKLASFDESVAVQAASILMETGLDLSGSEISKALQKASSKTKKGFQLFIKERQTAAAAD